MTEVDDVKIVGRARRRPFRPPPPHANDAAAASDPELSLSLHCLHDEQGRRWDDDSLRKRIGAVKRYSIVVEESDLERNQAEGVPTIALMGHPSPRSLDAFTMKGQRGVSP